MKYTLAATTLLAIASAQSSTLSSSSTVNIPSPGASCTGIAISASRSAMKIEVLGVYFVHSLHSCWPL